MRKLFVIAAAASLAACGSERSGTFEGEEGEGGMFSFSASSGDDGTMGQLMLRDDRGG